MISNNDGTGKRFRKTFRSRVLAQEECDRCNYAAEANHFAPYPLFTRQTSLSTEQLSFAENAYATIGARFPGENSNAKILLDAVEYYVDLRARLEKQKDVELVKAIEEFISEKKKSGRRDTYLKPLGYRIRPFAKIGGRVCSVTPQQITNFVTNTSDLQSQKSTRSNLYSFFSWALKKGYTLENPVERTETIQLEESEPEIISLENCKKMLEFAKSYRDGVPIPYLVVGLFCGLRPDEITRLEWKQIDLDQKLITIRGEGTKVRARRHVEIPEMATTWLETCKGGKLNPGRRALDALKRAGGYKARLILKRSQAGVTEAQTAALELPPWPADGLRHTSLSYHLARGGDEGKTALWGGTSPQMIHKHYRGLVRPAECKEFWALLP